MPPKGRLPPGLVYEARRTIVNPEIKDSIFFTKYGAETNGEYTELIVTLSPNGGNPPHYHTSYTETFTVLDGDLGVVLKGGSKLILKPGESRTIAINEEHSFFNPSSEATIKFVTTIRPAHIGFEQSLYILYGMAADGLCDDKGVPKSFLHTCIIVCMSDMWLAGTAFSIMAPVIKAVGAYAKWRGIEDSLLKKYWDA
ncbi:cupin 2 conserved barrel domain protein [Lipomyces starkeyi]